MSISLLFGARKSRTIGELQMDAVLSEVHDYQNDATQYSVEDGFDIGDNIRQLPEMINITGFVTNSPIDVIQARNSEVIQKQDGSIEIKNLRRTEVVNSVELAQDILLRIMGRKIDGDPEPAQIVDVVTGLRVYKDMVMTSLKIPRDATTGQAIKFEASLRHFRTVTSESVVLPNAPSERAQSSIDKGKQTAPKANVSILKKLANKISRFAGT